MTPACAARQSNRNIKSLVASAGVLAALLVTPALAGEIRWQAGTVRIDRKPAAEVATAVTMLAARADARHVVVQFDAPLTQAKRAELDAAGLTLLSYLSDHAYFAALSPQRTNAAAIAGAGVILDVRAVDRLWKLHPQLARNDIPDWARLDKAGPDGKKPPIDQVDPVVAVIVQFHADVPLHPTGVQIARNHGAAIRSELPPIQSLVIELPMSNVVALADEDAVKWIEPPLPPMDELNDDNRSRVGADIVQQAPYGLDGTGVSVMVYDGGAGLASHQDFGGRLFVRDSDATSDHATHVAGTIGGNGAGSAGLRRGMAPAVTIQSYGFEVPGGLQPGFLYTDPGDLLQDYTNAITVHGAAISNNSIGSNVEPNGFDCAWQGDYGTTAQLIDSIVQGATGAPFRIVWAAGNERQGSRCDVEGFGDYYSIAPPGAGKNHITVGALNSNDDSVTSFTSWGPTDDGRLKPDISGPGCQSNSDFGVTSCSSAGGYNVKCGTSMSSPTVCGVGALLLQDYRDLYPGEPDPLGSTLKVLFVHSAQDVESVGPDYRTGYGSVRAPAAVDLLRSGNFIEGEVDQGESFLILVIVNPGDPQAKITLAWDDEPATPNVSPSLVNDLDLRVTDGASTQHFPWTLNPLVPSAAAVRTQEDHLNNIEQVVIDSPAPGPYFIEVRGTNVPFGPQKFSIAATPLLVACSSRGVISLDRSKYACSSTATIQVVDCDLNTDDGSIQTVNVTINSTAEPGGETVLLTETAPETATFRGSIDLSTTNAAGTLLIADGDSVTASYTDADDGMGGVNVVVTSVAEVDCTPPIISGVQVPTIEPRSAVVTFLTDEPARSTLRYGSSCGALIHTIDGGGFRTSHSFNVAGLDDNSTYFFAIDAEDEAGNAASNDNGGSCFTFSTPEVPDFYTEEFGGDHDLDNTTLLFTPNGTVDFYSMCAEPITALPTDPSGGTPISLSDDDFEQINLGGGQSVQLYGTSYSSIFVGSNGYITFTVGDTDYTESLTDHFDTPRIAAHFDDLNPSTGGTVSWRQLADRVAVTWLNVPEYSTSNQNTFQIEMYFDGRIQISYLAMASGDSIAGLSEGLGVSPDYLEFDLSAAGNCGPQPPVANGQNVETGANTPIVISLQATDDGLPAPPMLSMVIDSLPLHELQDTGTGNEITAGDLPYTISSLGDQVTYIPTGGYIGPDSFQFFADDGGTPPEGGASNVATVSIVVGVRQPVHTFPIDGPRGWSEQGQWKFGSPSGGGTHAGDPSSGYTGSYVYGYNLDGDYNNNMAAVEYLTSTGIDCSNCTDTQLRFRRWLGVDATPGDNAVVQVSNNGSTWVTVWQHAGAAMNESSWSLQSYDISAVADGQSTVYLRWGMGPTNASITYPGWNLDDIEIWAVVPPAGYGDFDGDGDVDLGDFATFSQCFGGSGLPPAGGCPPGVDADSDGDGDVDLTDFAAFSQNFTG